MNERSYQFRVSVDAKRYRAYRAFDTITRRRTWVRPAIFAAILLTFAVVCFCLTGVNPQATLPGVLLAIIGLGMPLVYYVSFYQSLNSQIRKFKLDEGQRRYAYTVTLTSEPEGILAETNSPSPLRFRWDAVYMAYRLGDVIYLYVQASKAYILPRDGLTGDFEAAWAMIESLVPQGKARIRSVVPKPVTQAKPSL